VYSGKLLPQPTVGPNGGPKSPLKYKNMILHDKYRCDGGAVRQMCTPNCFAKEAVLLPGKKATKLNKSSGALLFIL